MSTAAATQAQRHQDEDGGEPPADPNQYVQFTSSRFVDYFFEVGLGQPDNKQSLLDKRLPVHNSVEGSQVDLSVIAVPRASQTGGLPAPPPPPPPAATTAPDGKHDPAAKDVHPLKYHFQAETLVRYPKTDWSKDEQFPSNLHMFCFPNDLTLVYNETSTPPDTFHTFISTDQAGVRSYGTCVTVYEKPKGELYRQLESAITKWGQANLSESDFEYFNHVNDQLVAHQAKLQKARLDPSAEPFEISMYEEKVALYEELLAPLKVTVVVKPEHIYVPRSIGVTSHWPWYALLKDWLCELVRQMRNPSQRGLYYAPLERCVINLLHEIPLPPPGKLEISINIGNVQLHCARPPVNTISILKNFSMYPLFRSMSVHHIVMIFELLLMEHKVIFVSSHYSMLNAAAETMINLIYPFYWHHLIVPILPARLMKCLDVPMPYIMGVHRKYFTQAVQAELRPPDAAVVDIDNDTIDNEEAFVGIPGRERRKLVSRIEKYIPVFLPPQASGLSRSGTGNALSSMAYAGGNPAASAASKGLPRLSENSSTSSPAGAPPLPTPATTSNGFSNLLSRRMSTPAPPNLPDGITDVRNTRGVPLTMQAAFPRGRAVFTTADSHIGARKVHDIPKSMYTKYANEFLQAKAQVSRKSQSSKHPLVSTAGSPHHHSQLLHGVSQSFDNLHRPPRASTIGPIPTTAPTVPLRLPPRQAFGSLTINTGSATSPVSGSGAGGYESSVTATTATAATAASGGSIDPDTSDFSSPVETPATRSDESSPVKRGQVPSGLSRLVATSSSSSNGDRSVPGSDAGYEWSPESGSSAPHVPSAVRVGVSGDLTPSDTHSVLADDDSDMFSSPEKEDGPIAGGALLNVFGNDRPPSVKRPNTWWASSRSETKSATSDEAKSPMAFGNIFSNFGSTVQKPASTTSAAPPAPQSTATGAAARTRGRPSSVGFDFTSKRTSNAAVDVPATRKTSPNPATEQAGVSVSPQKNILQRLWAPANASATASTSALSPAGSTPPDTAHKPMTHSNMSSKSLPLNASPSAPGALQPRSIAPTTSLPGQTPLRTSLEGADRAEEAVDAPPPVRIILKEGHKFHELIPVSLLPVVASDAHNHRFADIGGDDAASDAGDAGVGGPLAGGHGTSKAPSVMTGGTGGGGGSVGVGEGSCASSVVGIPYPESDDLADRFGVDSQSSDDYTRSEVSTDVRSQASRFGLGSSSSGAAGRRLGSVSGAAGMGPGQMTGSAMSKAASGDMLGSERRQSNFGSSLVLSRRETVRNTDLALCRMCREGLHTNQEKILMCEICHIQIHAGCLMSTEAHPCAGVFNEEKIRSSFLKVFTSLLKSYRSHLKNLLKPEPVPSAWSSRSKRPSIKPSDPSSENPIEGNGTGDDWFKKADFLAEFDSESKPFMTQIVDTQAFAQFILDRVDRPENDYEILFFDESIKAKLNRSKLRFTKETTPFLKDASYSIATSIQTLPPNLEDVPPDYAPPAGDPFAWTEANEMEARLIQPLLTESDNRIMRSHTNELVQRARLASSMRRKQDFSKWMRTKMKFFQKMGAGEIASIGFVSEDQRLELLEERLAQVANVIDEYEAAHVSSQTPAQVKAALVVLYEQNAVLAKATDEEQLVDSAEQDDLQQMLMRLIRVITIYEDHQKTLETSNATQLAVKASASDVPISRDAPHLDSLSSLAFSQSLFTADGDQLLAAQLLAASHGLHHNSSHTDSDHYSFAEPPTPQPSVYGRPETGPAASRKATADHRNMASIGARVAEWAADIFNDPVSDSDLLSASTSARPSTAPTPPTASALAATAGPMPGHAGHELPLVAPHLLRQTESWTEAAPSPHAGDDAAVRSGSEKSRVGSGGGSGPDDSPPPSWSPTGRGEPAAM